jgi:hypothetical protein
MKLKKVLWLVAIFFFATINNPSGGFLAMPVTGMELFETRDEEYLTDFQILQEKIDTHQYLAGLFVPNLFAFPVISQPGNNPAYVSPQPDVVTYFSLAEQHGIIGLLAHNTLAGKNFFLLTAGNILGFYKDESIQWYQVEKIYRFQALEPNSPTSNFRDLDHPERVLSASELFQEIYAQPGTLILQTCIARGQTDSWGRLFIVASPVSESDLSIYSLPDYSASLPNLLEKAILAR